MQKIPHNLTLKKKQGVEDAMAVAARSPSTSTAHRGSSATSPPTCTAGGARWKRRWWQRHRAPLYLDSKTNYGRGRAMMAVAPGPFYLLRELGCSTMAEEEGRVRGWGRGRMGDCDSH